MATKMKRWIAAMLALVMLMSVFAVTAMATEEPLGVDPTVYTLYYRYDESVPVGAEPPAAQSYLAGDAVTPTLPAEIEGYTFLGYTAEPELVDGKMPASDVTLTGSWMANEPEPLGTPAMLSLASPLSIPASSPAALSAAIDWTAAEITITTEAQLHEFAQITQGTHATESKRNFSGQTILLGADLTLTGDWYHRDSAGTVTADYRIIDFAGMFDGQNHTISNIRLQNEYDSGNRVGLYVFKSATGTIKNLTLSGIDADSVGDATFAGLASAVETGNASACGVENVHVRDVNVYIDNASTGSYSYVAGMIYWNGNYGKNLNCSVTRLTATVTGTAAAGGYAAIVAQNSEFKDCTVSGITFTLGSTIYGVGGFGGQVQSSSYWQRVFNNCHAKNVKIQISSLTAMAGGFLGNLGGMVDCDNCSASGSITVLSDIDGAHAGGFVGDLGWQQDCSSDKIGHTFDGCSADVDITAVNADVGGFVGMSAIIADTTLRQNCGMQTVFTDCHAYGDVKTTNGASGGFVGSGDRGEYKNCTASGEASGSIAGGFWGKIFSMESAPTIGNTGAGAAFTGIVISGCTATADYSGTTEGGLVGLLNHYDEPHDYTTPYLDAYNTVFDKTSLGSYVARIGGNYYLTLADAVAAANKAVSAVSIEVLKDIVFSADANAILTIKGDVTITGAHTISRGSYGGTIFNVPKGATLTLDGGLTIDGSNCWTFNAAEYAIGLDDVTKVKEFTDYAISEPGGTDAASVFISAAGVLTFKSATVQNTYSSVKNSLNGISLSGENAVLNLCAGVTFRHCANNGSGVVVTAERGATVNMYEGVMVDDNLTGGNHGMFKIYTGATLNMYGGTIKNTRGHNSNGTAVGVYQATFHLYGGEICGNSSVIGSDNGRCAAVYIHSNSEFTMSGGTICHNTGRRNAGGLDMYPSCKSGTITGGSIVDNVSKGGSYYHDVYDQSDVLYEGNGRLALTGGVYTQDVDEYCARGYVSIPYEDTARTDDYIVVPGYRVRYYAVEAQTVTDEATGQPTTVYNKTLVRKEFLLIPENKYWDEVDLFANNGSLYIAQDVENSRLIRAWFTNVDLTGEYDFGTEVLDNLDLYGEWIGGHVVRYAYNGEVPADPPALPAATVYATGDLVAAPTAPTAGGYDFYGWSKGDFTMPNEDVLVTGNWQLARTAPTGSNNTVQIPDQKTPLAAVPTVFSEDHYAYIIGREDGLIHPEDKISRAEVATIFFRLLSDEVREVAMTNENDFTDVAQGNWYNTAVSTMAAMGVLTGYPDGTFRPTENITRAEFAAIAARFDVSAERKSADFLDTVGHWAAEEIGVAANNGWVEGYNGYFRPNDDISRAEAMTMINRVLHRVPESKDDLLPDMILWPDNMDEEKWYYLAVQEATNGHDYKRKSDGTHETWTALRAARDWSALEN